MCVSLGEVLVRPLAEALSTEERARARASASRRSSSRSARSGRQEIERLKTSPNPAVRRTAIYLLREFGGSEALPELTELLDDSGAAGAARGGARHPQHRHRRGVPGAPAGADRAAPTPIARGHHAVAGLRPRRTGRAAASPTSSPRRSPGPLATVYLRAIEALGALKDPIGIAAADGGAAPRRVVGAAADAPPCARPPQPALARIGTPRRSRCSRRRRARVRAASAPPRACAASPHAPRRTAARTRLMTTPRAQLADELLRRFAASLRSGQLYSKGHPIIGRNLEALSGAFEQLHSAAADDRRSASSAKKSSSTTCRWRRRTRSGRSSAACSQIGVERITIDRGVTPDELATLRRRVDRPPTRATPQRASAAFRRCRTSASAASRSSDRHRKRARPTWPRSSGSTPTPCSRAGDGLGQRADRRPAGCRPWRAR